MSNIFSHAGTVTREERAKLLKQSGATIWFTGLSGSGKSTLARGLVSSLRRRGGGRLAVLAVDPSSPFSGGALLGDRVRMQEHALDPDVFIRSMASRGQLGGLAWATPQALRVLDAAGCDVVLIETVGVGQAEVEIAQLADTTIVLLAPGMGDGIQVAKAGILEVADLYVVNKADRDGAKQTVRDLRYMLSLGGKHSEAHAWRPPILSTVASRGEGIEEVVDALDKHRRWLDDSGERSRRQQERAAAEIEAIAVAALRERMGDVHGFVALGALAQRVVSAEIDPYTAADALLDELEIRDERA